MMFEDLGVLYFLVVLYYFDFVFFFVQFEEKVELKIVFGIVMKYLSDNFKEKI